MSNATVIPPRTPSRAINYLDHPPTYKEFTELYQHPLRPLVFNDEDLPRTWRARALWTTENDDGECVPNTAAIADTFPDAKAPVMISRADTSYAYGEESRHEISMKDFAQRWERASCNDDKLYLKDFHLCLADPSLDAYYVYPFFQDDWMNAYALHRTVDDYRFLYLGTSGTTTGLHHDVYLSHSWSTSICGVKQWKLLAPEYTYLLRHCRSGEPASDWYVSSDEDENDYPGLSEARDKALVVWQYPCETMFVPSGWYHSVQNFGPTLSINHNWANASCIEGMYNALSAQVEQSVRLLSDLRPTRGPDEMKYREEMREFYDLVYNNLCRPSWGWSFDDLWDVVGWMVEHPAGGERWIIDPSAALSIEHLEVKHLIAQLADKWLKREEASAMDHLRGKVMEVLSRCGQ